MASGNTLIAWDAPAFVPPATAYATPDVRNTQPVLDFDAAVAEAAHCAGVLPRHYSGGGLVARICWTATTAVAGACTWAVAFERHDPTTDLDADSFAAAITATPTPAPAVSGAPAYTEIAINPTQLAGLLVGEHFRLKISRPVGGGMAGDAELWSLELREA